MARRGPGSEADGSTDCQRHWENRQLTTMIAVIKDCLAAPSNLILAAILLSGCANTDRSDRQTDCAKARARYVKMKKSLGAYYATGTTSSAQIAIAEQRLRKAKKGYESACRRNAARRTN